MVGKRRRQLKKKLLILFWISFRFFFFNLVRSNLTTGTGIDQGETPVNRESLEMPPNINRSCLKVRLKTKPKVCLLVGCLASQQQVSVPQGRICSDNFTCCHTEIEVADQTFYLTQSQYTDTGPTSPSADPITPGAWQGSHWSANFEVTGMTRPRKNPVANGIRTRDLPFSRWTPYH